MNTPELTKKHKEEFRERIEKHFLERKIGLTFELKDWNDKVWSMLFVCQKGHHSEEKLADIIEGMFESFGMGEDDFAGCGFDHDQGGYVWIVSHPDIPDSVRKMIDDDIEREENEETERNRKAYENERKEYAEGFRLLKPRKQKAKGDSVYLVLANEFFDDIKHGSKKVEYREYNQFYADKLLGKESPLKFVLLQNGYGGPGRPAPEKMRFEIAEIVYVDDELEESPCYENDGSLVGEDGLPKDFYPTMFGIKLGKRVDQ